MASEVTDQDVQDIQNVTRPLLEGRNDDSKLLEDKNCEKVLAGNDTIDVKRGDETKHYKVVNSTNDDIDGATQALAVAPCDENGNNVDYSQTVITVGGTDLSNTKSRGNAFDVALGSNLTEQTEGVDAFYNQTNSIVSEHDNGKISVISGHSQGDLQQQRLDRTIRLIESSTFNPMAVKMHLVILKIVLHQKMLTI